MSLSAEQRAVVNEGKRIQREARKAATRAPVTIEKRKPLNRRESLQLMLDQNGRCGCGCGVKLDPMKEGVIDEHRVALALGGSNDLANRELWRKPCAGRKTAAKDAPAIAKAKRIEARLNGTRRPRKPIASQGFDRTKSRGFDGKVRPRPSHPHSQESGS